MEEQKFKEILEEAGVPPACRDDWFKQHKIDNGAFKLNYNQESLLLFAKIIVEKGCATSAPW